MSDARDLEALAAEAAERLRLAQGRCRRLELALDDAYLQLLEVKVKQDAGLRAIDALIERARALVERSPSRKADRLLAEALRLRERAERACGLTGNA